ncbi:M50 family metallopeptidase [Paenibacillus eucommiae]|uniref:Neutral ceramidase superfamily lipid hydrolase n=1 Tax=Paenibacillus eucommiae TaxID=1355755 RepID=A0ABS4J4D5_9BACL|nr:M50 family metallopeptidase [Paenibacillus eucommiae]MBP1994150.1 putative neutral ceramidase superfamily lipid hydrolase [Paenibacillus eucommiae]
MGNWVKTILFLIGSALLTHLVPSSFFRNLDTMVHEFGHAIITLALSGNVMFIELYADHSGVTYSTITKSWSIFPIALSGYMTASLFTWYLFAAYAKGRQRQGLIVITLLAIVSLVLFVRNSYGVTFLGGFIALNVIVMLLTKAQWIRNFYYLLLAFLCLEESVFGPFSLMVYAWSDPNKAGDASILSNYTGLPAILWAGLFTLFALWCAKQAVQAFLGRHKSKRAYRAPVPSYRE